MKVARKIAQWIFSQYNSTEKFHQRKQTAKGTKRVKKQVFYTNFFTMTLSNQKVCSILKFFFSSVEKYSRSRLGTQASYIFVTFPSHFKIFCSKLTFIMTQKFEFVGLCTHFAHIKNRAQNNFYKCHVENNFCTHIICIYFDYFVLARSEQRQSAPQI